MPKRCIGIDLGRSHVHAAQVVRTAEGLRLEKAFAMQTRRSSDSLPRVLHSLMTEHGFDGRADVAVCLPHHAFFFADVETDAKGLESIRALDPEVLKDHFPIPAQDLVAQICSVLPLESGKNSVLVAASSRQQLDAGLQALREAKVKPARLETPVAAGQATILTNHPDCAAGLAVILYIDPATLSLAVTHDGRLLLVRNIPMCAAADQEGARISGGSVAPRGGVPQAEISTLGARALPKREESRGGSQAESFARQMAEIVAQEIEITWKRLFGNDPDPGLRIFLIAPATAGAALLPALRDRTGNQVIPVDPYARVARSDGVDANLPISIAEGLALAALEPEANGHTDFLTAYRVRTRPKLRPGKELAVCGTLAAAAAVVWLAGLFLQLSSLESTHRQLKKQTEAVFHQAVPEEQNIIDPVAQLQQRLDACRKDCDLLTSLNPGRSAPLEVLYALSHSTPTVVGLKLHDVLITGNSLRIAGSCDSFITFYDWRRQLEAVPGLRVVDARPARDGSKVKFTIALSISESKA